jgi:hypothetical protein
MVSRLTYRKKLIWLVAATILSIVLCYTLAFRHTFHEYAQFQQAAGSDDPDHLIKPDRGELAARYANVTRMYDRYLLDTLSSDKNLLSITSNYCKDNRLRLKEYKTIGVSKNDSMLVLTRIVTIEGGFIADLRLVNELEAGKNAGRVSSVEFRSYSDPRDKLTKLDCTIYIQNLIPDQDVHP